MAAGTTGMERQLKKLKEDSYAVRKEEGRPKHGLSSFTVLGVGGASWFFFALALVLPKWRQNYMGILGYPHTRSWGLFSIIGMETMSHHEYMGVQCRYFSQMAPGGLCMTPICLWYRTKCLVAMNMAFACYSTGFFYILVLILHSLCLVWTMRMTPRLIRWAATWWCCQVVLHIAVLMFYVFMSAECFVSLDNESIYPEPNFSYAFMLELLVIMMVSTCAILSLGLVKMWPESSSSSGSDDSDDSDSEDSMYGAQPGYDPNYGGPPPGYDQGPPPGYDPNYGGPPPGYGPPQGYDPNAGYGPPGGQAPGYGPPQGQWQG